MKRTKQISARATRPARFLLYITLLGVCISSLAGCGGAKQPTVPTALPTPPALLTKTPEPETEESADYAALARSLFDRADAIGGEAFSYEETEGGILLTAYNGRTAFSGTGDTVIIPAAIDGKPVVALGDRLFYGNSAIVALSIPASVQTVGHELLTGCNALTAVSLPFLGESRTAGGIFSYLFTDNDSVQTGGYVLPSTLDTVILTEGTEIADYAFSAATRLRLILLPDTLQKIGAFAFANCRQLHYVPLPSGLSFVGEYAFVGCDALTAMEIPESVTTIGGGVFTDCNHLTRLSLPFLGASRTEGSHFGYLFGLTSPYWNGSGIPSSLYAVTLGGDVPENGFYGCENLVSVTLTDCSSIGTNAFRNCRALYEIALPDTLKKIGDQVFLGCTSLYAITLPEGLSEMGINAFTDCTNLTSVRLPASLTALPASAFSGCLNLSAVDLSGCSVVGDEAFRLCVSLSEVTGLDKNAKIGIGNDFLSKND